MKIRSSFHTPMETHRGDFETCPACNFSMNNVSWEKNANTLVLEPSCSKSSAVAIFSECPKCFENSWIHVPMNSFQWSDFSKKWKSVVKKFEADVKLAAARQWGCGLCHKCVKLESATIEYSARRVCEIGIGPPETECKSFIELKVI